MGDFMIKVSIIVPIYNTEKYLRKCLNSLVNQTLEEIEIIVINDGSPDNSQEIIDEYVGKYPAKIKSYRTNNCGVGAARNLALQHANGKYIAFVDSDDYVDLNMYEKMYNEAEEKKSDIVICSIMIENGGKSYPNEISNIFSDAKINTMMFGNTSVCNKLYRKSIIEGLLFNSQIWYEDVDYGIKAILNAERISLVNEPLYHYLVRQGSIMNNDNIEKNLDILSAFDDLLKYLKNNKEFNKYQEEIEYLAIIHILIYAVVRVIKSEANYNKKKKIIKKLSGYIRDNFKHYRNNQYLYLLNGKNKIIFKLATNNSILIIKYIFEIKRILIRTKRKELAKTETTFTGSNIKKQHHTKTTSVVPTIKYYSETPIKVKKLTRTINNNNLNKN